MLIVSVSYTVESHLKFKLLEPELKLFHCIKAQSGKKMEILTANMSEKWRRLHCCWWRWLWCVGWWRSWWWFRYRRRRKLRRRLSDVARDEEAGNDVNSEDDICDDERIPNPLSSSRDEKEVEMSLERMNMHMSCSLWGKTYNFT